MDKKRYILNEIEELNKKHKKIQKSQIWWLIGALVGLVFFPITIGVVIVMILNARKMSKIRGQIKEKQREVDMTDIEHDTYRKHEEKKQPLKHEQKKTEPKMNKKIQKKLLIAVVGIILFCVVLIGLFGNSIEKANEKHRLLTEQAQKEEIIVKPETQPQSGTASSGERVTEENIELDCPSQGFFQSDWDYCVELEMIGHSGDISKRIAESRCDSGQRIGMDKWISNLKCKKCNECTEEQFKKIQEKKKEEAEKQKATEIYNACFSKCKNETQSLKECQNECATVNRICNDCMVKINECIDECKDNP